MQAHDNMVPRINDVDRYDDEIIVVSTIGQGPAGPEGRPATQAQIYQAMEDLSEAHPELFTTVEDNAITTRKIADGAVTPAKLSEPLGEANIADDAVTSRKLANGSVSPSKLASNAVDALPVMSSSSRGVAKVGAGLSMNGDAIELAGDGDIATAVQEWMDAHPEASTTVADGSITMAKVADGNMLVEDDERLRLIGLLDEVGSKPGLNLIDENDPDMWHQGWYGETVPRIYSVESVQFACVPNATLITGCISFPGTARYYGIRWYTSEMTFLNTQVLSTAGLWYRLTIPEDCYYFTVFFTSDMSTVALNKSDIVNGHPRVVAMFMSYREHFSVYDESQFVPHLSSMAEDFGDALSVLDGGMLQNLIYGRNLTYHWYYGHTVPLWFQRNDNANIYMVEPVRISSGTRYYYKHLYAYFCHLAYDDGSIDTFSNSTDVDISGSIVAQDDGWALLVTAGAFVSEGSTQKPFFGEDRRACNMGVWKPVADTNVYHCEKNDELADFDNLVEAINTLSSVKDATLYVGPGTWDLVADWDSYDSTYLASFPSDGSKRGLELGNRLRVVFSGNATVECDCSGKSDNVKEFFSPLNTGAGGFTIENMTMNAKSVRYCIHDERRSAGREQYVNRFVGCKFYLDNSENTPWPHVQVIGGGLGTNGYITIESCQFEAVGADERGIVTYHNNNDVDNVGARSRILFKDNYIAGRNQFRFNWYGNSDLVSQAICTGNSWGLEPTSFAETPSSTHQNVEIIAWNNELRS